LKKLPLLLGKSFVGPFIGTFVVSIFLFLMQFLWKYIGDLVGKGIEWYIILEFIVYSIPYLIPRALPLAVLLSSIMTFGNLGERYELVAMKSAGLSLIKIMMPMLVIMGIIGGIAFYSSNWLIPKANLSWGSLFHAVTHKKPAMNIQDGIFFNELKGYSIRVGHKHEDNQTIEDILIYAKLPGERVTNVILAKRGKMMVTENKKFLMLTLEEGTRYQEMTAIREYNKTMPHNRMRFEKYELAIDLSELQLKRQNPELFKENYDMLNLAELTVRVDSIEGLIDDKKRFLGGYLETYFHLPTDSTWVQLSKDSVVDPFYASIKFNIHEQDTTQDTVTVEDNPFVKTKRVALKNDDLVKYLPKDREKTPAMLLEKAVQSQRNMKKVIEQNAKDVSRLKKRSIRFNIERHKKFTLAFSCILLFFVGAPLGAIIRKGGFGLPMIIAILLFIVYFILTTVGQKLAREGVMEVWAGAWLSSMIFIPIALFLTYKASTDSVLFDSDAYTRVFRKLFKKK
jgi:lipopolysaccharide export system permease protein